MRQEVTAYKVARGCEKCGEKHPATLDFHHLDPTTKEYNIGATIHMGNPAEVSKVWDEIAKCVVLCANCHRKEHWKESTLDG